MFKIEIDNFRSFKKQNFDFSKINILIGENSSGKSSLLKLFLALKQTLQTPTNRETLFAITGELVDLGNYKENIYYHNEDLPLNLKFTFDKNYNEFLEQFFTVEIIDKEAAKKEIDKVRKLIGGPIESETVLNLCFNKIVDKHESIIFSVYNDSIGKVEIIFEQKEKQPSLDMFYGKTCKISYFDNKLKKTYVLDEINYEKDGFLSLITAGSLFDSIEKILGIAELKKSKDKIPDKTAALLNVIFYKIAFLLITQNYLRYFLDKIEYINPIETKPSRIYLNKDNRQNQKIKSIEDVVDFFSSNSVTSRKALKDFIKILHDIGIVDSIEILKDERLPVRELRVKVKDLVSNILDVGYGVSLQLPIILKSLLAERIRTNHDTIMLIEQPEVHLHPKLHAKLIEAIVQLSEHTTYFVETHSEHIIRKLQVLVKDKSTKLSPEDVTIHYFVRKNKQSIITQHKINEDGHLSPKFPSGFFDNSYLLSKELLF